MMTLSIIFDLIKEYKKTSAAIFLTIVLMVLWMVFRFPQWWNCQWDGYNLDKPVELRLFTGKCMVNVGTDVEPNWVPSDRIFGALGGETME
jgi:hypothetical protein